MLGPKPEHRDAWVEIDLGAVVANCRALQSLCSPSCAIMPVVKANAYGHGAVPVSRALAEAGFGCFGVATLDEALELRDAGIGARVVLLYEPPLAAFRDALQRDVEIAVGTPEGLATMRALAPAERARARIQLKLDTGMSRQGLRVDRLDRHEDDLRALAGQVKGVWTHFADGADRTGTEAQLECFDQANAWLRGLGIDAERHTSGSAAVLAGLGTAYEMARPGLALYGLTPAEWNDRGLVLPTKLTPVMSVRARAVRLERLPSGTRVGYSGTFEVTGPAWIALLPVGYADGLRRSLSNGRSFALHAGEKVPVVGRVSMDSCTLDVTSLAGIASLGRDSVFTLVGSDGNARITVEELARAAGTISQEVLLGFDDRLPMVYLGGPGVG